MSEFIEERLSLAVRQGAGYGDAYAVEIVTTGGGQESRSLKHPFPVRRFNIAFVMDSDALGAAVLDLYHRAYGQYAGFRVRIADDYSTNGWTGTPGPADQAMALVSTGVYQLQKAYGAAAPVTALGRPVRTLFKPVAGTVRVAIAGVEVTNTGRTRWTVVTTTGRVTFADNITNAITGITQAASAVVTVGSSHVLRANDVVHFSSVVGMTQINGLRGTITSVGATTVTVDIDTTLFTAYSSGGTLNTRPQSGEAVTAGCEFDVPMRFNSAIDIEMTDGNIRTAQGIELIELLNP